MQQVTTYSTKNTTRNASHTQHITYTHATHHIHTYHNTVQWLQDNIIQSIHHESTKSPHALHHTPQKQGFHKALPGTCYEVFFQPEMVWWNSILQQESQFNRLIFLHERTCPYQFVWYKLRFLMVYCGWVDMTSLSCLGHGRILPAIFSLTWSSTPTKVEKRSSMNFFQSSPRWLTCGFKADFFSGQNSSKVFTIWLLWKRRILVHRVHRVWGTTSNLTVSLM